MPVFGLHASTSLPPVPKHGFGFRASRDLRRCGTMKALTPARVTPRAGLPAYRAIPSRRSISNHVMRPDIALSANCQRVGRVSDFAMNEQARRYIPPNRVRYPTDRRFASGCSPPRLAATQLPSATGLWLTPARTCTVLLWRLHRRTHAGESRHLVKPMVCICNRFRPRPSTGQAFRRDDGRWQTAGAQIAAQAPPRAGRGGWSFTEANDP